MNGNQKSLEERLRDARPRVLVVDDNPNDLELILRHLNRLGARDNLKFAGTTSPREALKLLTQDGSFWATILDVVYNFPSNELAKFPDGTALAREVSGQRYNLDYIFMSGDPSLVRIIQNISNIPDANVFTAWEKPSRFGEAELGVLYNYCKTLISKRARPKNPRLYILEGSTASGKTTLINGLERIMPWVASCVPTTYRKQAQTRDKAEPDREFMDSFEGITEKIMHTDNPLVWALVHNPNTGSLDELVFTNKADYLKAASSRDFKSNTTAINMVNLDRTAHLLAEGYNVLAPIRVHKVSEELKKYFGGFAHIVSLYVSASERARRARFGERQILEFTQRFLGDETEHPGETVLDTEYPQVSNNPQYNFELAMRHVSDKTARLITEAGNVPYDGDIHSAYIEKVERTLRELGRTDKLETGKLVRIPQPYAEKFQKLRRKAYSSKELSIVDAAASLVISNLQIKPGVKSVTMVPYSMRKVASEVRDKEPWKDIARDFMAFCLKEAGGLEPAEASPAQPGIVYIVYTLTDGQPLLRKDLRSPYRLELAFL